MSNSKKTIIGIVAGIVILAFTFGFVYLLMQETYTKPTYTFSDNSLVISGKYGATIDLTGANVMHELSQFPTIESKTNGASIGSIAKGQFMINGAEVYLSVMDKDMLNYILITDKNGSKYYINSASEEETNDLYKEISKYIK